MAAADIQLVSPITVPTPTAAGHAATKGYVDTAVSDGLTAVGANVVTPDAHGFLAWTGDPSNAGSSTAVTAGVLYLSKIQLIAPATIASINVHVSTAGTSLTNCFLALYNSAGVRQAVSANQSTAWQTGGTSDVAMVTPYDAAAGTYYVGILVGGGTPPAFARAANSTVSNAGLSAGSYRFSTSGTSQTAAPSSVTLASTSASSTAYWTALKGDFADAVLPTSMTDATGVAFTDSGGLAGVYHLYGAGLPSSGAGLVIHLHGDGAYEYTNPTDNYCLAGNRGLIAVAKAKGYALLVPKAPDTTSTVTWWEAGARNATYLAELLDSLVATYGIDRSKIWLSGYSGGSVFINAYFVPTYGKAQITGGGALMLGGGNAAASTPVGWDSTFKAAFPMYWVTGGQDDGTYAGDGYDALTAATAGKTYYAGQGFTTTQTTPPGIGHEIDGAFGPILDDVLPTLSGYSPPSRTPGTTRPTLVTSYLVTAAADDTSTLTTTSFTPSAGEVIVVKAFDADYGSPNIAGVVGGGLTYATKIHIQATSKAEAWIFAAEVGDTATGSMTVSVSWFGTVGRHGIVVERWSSGLVKGVPAQGVTVMGTGAPSSSITPTNANSVLTWLDTDWNVVAGTAAYRTSATQTQTASLTTVRAYAAYQNSPSTSAQTVGLTAPTGQAWAMGAIEILPAP
jgi:poly(3-hydroxybutyrate) depolymerase